MKRICSGRYRAKLKTGSTVCAADKRQGVPCFGEKTSTRRRLQQYENSSPTSTTRSSRPIVRESAVFCVAASTASRMVVRRTTFICEQYSAFRSRNKRYQQKSECRKPDSTRKLIERRSNIPCFY